MAKLGKFTLRSPLVSDPQTTDNRPSSGSAQGLGGALYSNIVGDIWRQNPIPIDNPHLLRPRRYDVYNKMEARIEVIGAFKQRVTDVVSQVAFKPLVETPEEEQRWRIALGILLRPEWLERVLEGYFQGFSLVEWALSEDPSLGIIGANAIPPRDITSFRFDALGNPTEFYYRPRLSYENPAWINRAQCAYLVNGKRPFGEGAYYNASATGLLYINLLELVNRTSQANLRGKPSFKIPTDQMNAEDPLFQALDRLSKDANFGPELSLILGSDVYEAETNAGDNRPAAAAKMFEIVHRAMADVKANDLTEMFEKRIALLLGMNYHLLGRDGAGSLNLATVQSSALSNAVRMAIKMVSDTLNSVADVVYAIRGWGIAPDIVHDFTSFIDAKEKSQMLVNIGNALKGGTPLSVINRHLSEIGYDPITLEEVQEVIDAFKPDEVIEVDENEDEENG